MVGLCCLDKTGLLPTLAVSCFCIDYITFLHVLICKHSFGLLFFFFFLVLPLYCYQPISLDPRAHMLSHVTPWTVACQAPLSMDFFRQEYWSRLPFPSPPISMFFIPMKLLRPLKKIYLFIWLCWVLVEVSEVFNLGCRTRDL